MVHGIHDILYMVHGIPGILYIVHCIHGVLYKPLKGNITLAELKKVPDRSPSRV